MSVIVAVRKNGIAAIASDTQVSQGSIVVPAESRCYPPKIHSIAGAYVGVVGDIAHNNVLRSLSVAKPDLFNFQSGDEVFETLRKIYPLLRDEYFLDSGKNEDDQDYVPSQMHGLIVSAAGVYSFSGNRDVSEYTSFWATGSGMEFALGAAEALYTADLSALSIAQTAATIACKFDSSCGLPLECYQIELQTK